MATTVGIQVFDSTSTLQWDSRTALGGVVGDYRQYAAGASGETINYPQGAGLNALLLDCGGADGSVSLDTSGSYPVVTVAPLGAAFSFALLVW